jgi:sugar lactone lactonase YvrE
MNTLEHYIPSQNEAAEVPMWIPEEKALYWADEGKCLWRFDSSTGEQQSFDVGVPLKAFARRTSGEWIIVAQAELFFWDQQTGERELVADLSGEKAMMQFNDCVVDRQGRLLVGTFNSEDWTVPDGALYRLDIDRSLHKLDSGFATANGLGLSPDGKTLYLTDMLHSLIYAYDYDTKTGDVSNRRDLIHVPEEKGVPDGLTVDSEGYIWSAQHRYSVTRHDPDGNIDREIEIPTELVTCLTFGGEQMDEIFITTAWWGFSKEKRDAEPHAGDIFRMKVDVKGLQEHRFAVEHI